MMMNTAAATKSTALISVILNVFSASMIAWFSESGGAGGTGGWAFGVGAWAMDVGSYLSVCT
jgi:hypothetical protein